MGYSVCAFGAVLLLAICTAEGNRGPGGFYGYGGGRFYGLQGGGIHHHYHGVVHNHWGSREDSDENDDKGGEEDDEIYRFSIGGNYGPYEYQDEDGRVKGFHIDLIYAVCAKAGKKCNWITTKYSDCWAGPSQDGSNLEYPGAGLLGGYFDACIGWSPTPERQNAFNFSTSYCKDKELALFYNKGTEGDLLDLTGKKVGFVTGWLFNEKCLARQTNLKGNQPGEYTAVYYNNNHERAKGLRKGEIDTGIGVKSHVDTTDVKDWTIAVDVPLSCAQDGEAVMARYSRMDLIDWWNDAFEEMRETGEFRRLCDRAKRDHGQRGVINCAL